MPERALTMLRAPKMSGCAYWVDMHSTGARALGESEQRLYALNVWPETPLFTRRESAARAWTEAVTDISAELVLNEVYRLTRERFHERQPVGSHDGTFLE
jgi:AhpD family alkylhydroperoxidase